MAAGNRLDSLRSEAAACRACPLWENATQTVFGEGPPDAEIMLVGEQPGDKEDLAGRPFVGPAGLLLDRALAEAGVDRARVYVTNAVKHFKFEPRGKRRLHKRPNASEIKICRRWLVDEIEAIRPRLIVALGATAAQGLAGRAIPVGANRGAVLDIANGLRVFVTIHPSALLRLQDEEEKRLGYASFVDDLRSVEKLAKAAPPKPNVRAAG
jgi:uracil-DNA glycosylase